MSLSEVQLPAAYRRHVLLTVQLVILAALIAAIVVATFTYSLYVRLYLLGTFLLISCSWWLTRRGQETLGAGMMMVTILVLTTLLAVAGQGLNDIALGILPAQLILGGLVLSSRTYYGLVISVIVAVLVVAVAVTSGTTVPTRVAVPNPWGEASALLVILLAEAAMVQILVRGIRRFFADAESGRLALQLEMQERRQAEQAVRELNAELEQRVNERTADLQTLIGELESFNYSVSHDLRAPLRAVLGFNQMAQEELPESATASQQYLQRSTHAAHRMGELINDLLRLSRTSTQPLQLTAVPSFSAVNGVLQHLTAPERHIITVEDETTGLQVFVDIGLLQLALTNLINNAIKYSSKHSTPKVTIRLEAKPGEVWIAVKDNGIGFDAKDAERLFKPFSRLGNASGFEGTGIGLAIVRRVAERLHGRVWASSASGAGACFTLAVPAASASDRSAS